MDDADVDRFCFVCGTDPKYFTPGEGAAWPRIVVHRGLCQDILAQRQGESVTDVRITALEDSE